MREEDEVGVRGRRVDGGEQAGTVRGQHVFQGPRGGQQLGAALAQPAQQAGAPRGGEVAALRKDHQRVRRAEVLGEAGDLRGGVVPLLGIERDEAVRGAAQQSADQRIDGECLAEYEPWPASEGGQERVGEQEGVAGARVPAGDDQGAAGHARAVRRRRDVQGETASGGVEEPVEQSAQQSVVLVLIRSGIS